MRFPRSSTSAASISPDSRRGRASCPRSTPALTIRATLANPFPDGVAEPPGASLGPNTFLGRGIGRFNNDLRLRQRPVDAVVGRRAARAAWAVGRRGRLRRQPELRPDDRLQHESRCRGSTCRRATSAITATNNFLTATVPNPFRGLLPGETLNGDAQRQQLLRPFPQFQEHRHSPLRRIEQLRLGAVPA